MATRRRLRLGVSAALVAAILVLGAQSRELITQIEIEAPREVVWQILTDLNRYEEWNLHITRAEGEVGEGRRLTIQIVEPDGSSMTLRPTVTRVVPNSELRWLGHLLLPRVLDGEHIFEILESGDGRVRFVQREKFRGLLVLPLWSKLNTQTRQGFVSMNAALKTRVEAAGSGQVLLTPPSMDSAPLDDELPIERIAFGSCYVPQSRHGSALCRVARPDPLLVTWDDHDCGLNDAGGDRSCKRPSEALFEDVWNVGTDDPRRAREGIYHARTAGPYPITEVTSSSLNFPMPEEQVAGWEEPDSRRVGDLYFGANFGLMVIDWESGTIQLELRDDSGITVATLDVALSDLNPEK